ncbi:predicted protein [Postia placenta Mad-698-R]|uniref:Uncharacterized protein n=1 Tax=Postia placenta MAD-698-R-SB12 TaxID=670580 RepID=A0A1X6NEX4_9APHY|nr:hypothetical protein POSPLADRAFT_1130477 [Postia placenta MAD-698-R-SB12]EED80216.1 predicted protein [Postia placenta Mad-698-R]OSX66996.1 hypothetical protein POSPLADRAFT_1130477 [Postia placenta MAD-698-R-SB12]
MAPSLARLGSEPWGAYDIPGFSDVLYAKADKEEVLEQPGEHIPEFRLADVPRCSTLLLYLGGSQGVRGAEIFPPTEFSAVDSRPYHVDPEVPMGSTLSVVMKKQRLIKSPEDFEDGDIRKTMPHFSAEHFQNNLMLVNSFKPVAARCRATSSAQIALAWILAEYPDYTNLGRLENVKSAEIMLNDDSDGERYPTWFFALMQDGCIPPRNGLHVTYDK